MFPNRKTLSQVWIAARGAGSALLTVLFVATLVFSTPEVRGGLVIAGLAVWVASWLLTYLQSRPPKAQDEIQPSARLDTLRQEVDELKQLTGNAASFTPSERERIVSEVTATLSHDAVAKIASVWAADFERKSADQRHETDLLKTANLLVDRLENEINDLGRRANINLVIGILISGLGLAALTWFVVSASIDFAANVWSGDVAVRFGVKSSLAIFIQIFAYFFLRLYRYSIFEIKYFQNEITGAQFKVIALLAARAGKDAKTADKVCLELAKTERNFILKRGETTVALQRDEIERDYESRLITMIEKILGAERKPTIR
jgi:hypothetical protein